MTKQELIDYIDKISLTGPGGRQKIKKVLRGLTINGGGGGGGGGGEDIPTLSKFVYYGGKDAPIPVDSQTSTIMSRMPSSNKGVIENVPCYSKYYYIGIPTRFSLTRVMTENSENITGLFSQKGVYAQDGTSYMLYEFHLSSDMPLNVDITITVTE